MELIYCRNVIFMWKAVGLDCLSEGDYVRVNLMRKEYVIILKLHCLSAIVSIKVQGYSYEGETFKRQTKMAFEMGPGIFLEEVHILKSVISSTDMFLKMSSVHLKLLTTEQGNYTWTDRWGGHEVCLGDCGVKLCGIISLSLLWGNCASSFYSKEDYCPLPSPTWNAKSPPHLTSKIEAGLNDAPKWVTL